MSENGLHKIPAMRAALVAIQELHKPVSMHRGLSTVTMCSACPAYYPCPTRKLADEALGGGQDG